MISAVGEKGNGKMTKILALWCLVALAVMISVACGTVVVLCIDYLKDIFIEWLEERE